VNTRRRVIAVYCNGCGTVFSTVEPYQRFCSVRCSSRFWRILQRVEPSPSPAPMQHALLAELRRLPGEWIDLGALVTAMYGLDDFDSRHAFRVALLRLRATWGDRGLVIGCRVQRMTRDRASCTRYRLERDITTEEVAS